jgi:hypothetical protein
MNADIPEEAGQTARSLVSALKESPITLASVVFNVVFLIVVFLAVRDNRAHLEEFQNRLFDQQKDTMEKLYNCTPNPPRPTPVPPS